MIERHSRAGKAILFFMMGIAVAILSVGSLINFHQYKIWHKPLIPKLVAYKRDNEKLAKVIFLAKTFKDNKPIQKVTPGLSSVPSEPGKYFPVYYNAPEYRFTGPDIVAQILSSAGLRAPPGC